ncbi:unnamed protein product [Nesidiocoris tenuis]|uniref:Uncharacterized protein n=1 Tax=Nesidiocoris tenuis TaxID=355587 RepID=A0A6H5H487_9HEMI|nr:unnamed protein product [Nesidiocoris tenuis]
MAESEGQIYEKQLSGVKFKWRNFRYNSSNAWSPRAAPRVRYLDPPIACPTVHASRTINRLSRNCYIKCNILDSLLNLNLFLIQATLTIFLLNGRPDLGDDTGPGRGRWTKKDQENRKPLSSAPFCRREAELSELLPLSFDPFASASSGIDTSLPVSSSVGSRGDSVTTMPRYHKSDTSRS